MLYLIIGLEYPTNMKEKLISIIILTKDRANYLKQSLDSIFNQSYRPLEIIVIDSESKDNTEEIIKEYINKDINLIYKKVPRDTNISKARNEALNLCQSEYIAVLDSDDIWSNPNKLSEQKKYLDENKDCVLVGTFVQKIDSKGEVIGDITYKETDNDIRKNMLLRNQFTQSSVMFRNNSLRYDENLKIWEDYDLWLRLGTKGKFANLPFFYTKYRVHNSNISKENKTFGAKLHLQIIKKYKDLYPNYLLALIKGYLRFLK